MKTWFKGHGSYMVFENLIKVMAVTWFPTPIIMGSLKLKICQNFVGAKIFSYICDGIKLYGRS